MSTPQRHQPLLLQRTPQSTYPTRGQTAWPQASLHPGRQTNAKRQSVLRSTDSPSLRTCAECFLPCRTSPRAKLVAKRRRGRGKRSTARIFGPSCISRNWFQRLRLPLTTSRRVSFVNQLAVIRTIDAENFRLNAPSEQIPVLEHSHPSSLNSASTDTKLADSIAAGLDCVMSQSPLQNVLK